MSDIQFRHEAIQAVADSIQKGEADHTEQALENLLTAVQQDPEAINEVTDPPVINALHTQLIEAYKMSPRSMMLRNRVPRRSTRARLFVQAMINGIRKRPL